MTLFISISILFSFFVVNNNISLESGSNEDRLRESFQAFGEVVEAVIMKDRNKGRARAFGFVVLLTLMLQKELSRKSTL